MDQEGPLGHPDHPRQVGNDRGGSVAAPPGPEDRSLDGPGQILLVSCYEPGYQPLALASPAAFLAKAGYAPDCLDLAVEDLETAGLPRLKRARLVAISVPMHTATVLGLRVAEIVRGLNPGAHICFYGLYAHLNRQLLMGAPSTDASRTGVRAPADTVFGPECEELLVTLADSLGDRRRGLAEPGAPAAAPTGSPGRLHRLPFLPPERTQLPALDRYARLLVGDERRVTGYVETTRGCLYLCRHCPIPPFYEGRFFAVPADVALDDVSRQVAAGARHIVFGDPDFLNSAKHALGIARRLHASHPEITFSFTSKVEHIISHRDVFPELAALGCVFMVSAVESLSDRVLEILDKRHTGAEVLAALDIVRGAGISLRPTFVAFTPWTTLQDYLALCELIASRHLEEEVDPVQLAIRLLIPPGSLLLNRPELTPFLDATPFDPTSLTHAWTHPDARMDRLCEAVTAVAEEAAAVDEEPALTFRRIHRLAATMDGSTEKMLGHRDSAALAAQPGENRRRTAPPRLSEPWFCCAQPTRTQLGARPAAIAMAETGATATPSKSCCGSSSGDGQQGRDLEGQPRVRGT